MIAEILFFTGLYWAGWLVMLPLHRQLPTWFVVISASLWGALLWTLGVAVALVLRVPFTAAWMACWIAALLLLAAGLHWRKGGRWPQRKVLVGGLGMTLFTGLVVMLALRFNYLRAVIDGLMLIVVGRNFVIGNFPPWAIQDLMDWGFMVPALQAASVFLERSYLAALHATLTTTGLLIFIGFMLHTLRRRGFTWRSTLALGGLGGLVLATTPFIWFQTIYIHNNILSAIYLFTATAALVCFTDEENPAWLWVVLAGLVAVGLLRIEGVMFALMLLALTLSSERLRWHDRLSLILPFIVGFLIWFAQFTGQSAATTLNAAYVWLILAMLAAAGLATLTTRIHWIERMLLPRLNLILPVTLLFLLVVLFGVNPDRMRGALAVTTTNLINSWWGISWLMLLGLSIFGALLPASRGETLLAVFVATHALLLLALLFPHGGARVSFQDSGNRIFTNVLPLLLYMLVLRYSQLLTTPEILAEHKPSRLRRTLVGGAAGGLAACGLLLILAA